MDRVVAVDASSAVTERRIVPGGQLDGDALWPPLLVEGLAQTAAILDARRDGADGGPVPLGLFVGVRRFDLHRAPRVGELVRFRVQLVRRLHPASLMTGTATVGDELLAEGELKFWVEDVP